ncbi:uncharacterized protein Nmlp_2231 [Natronomonas moolapensis 8.8.11]|uniref:Uncharacterized protein n=1 Tax=Natronomonas moolapensis (strain DSM 18674 / CECT 7526 / JCM 14361 / 8.8.11) TaxID=268739 RepID=M1XQM0_NATM8|nr:uncharacterized protein Nmlp_2231 [Natronomonas moolapensis 8.8.11]
MRLLPRPSMANQRRITLGMRAALAALVGYGVVAGEPKAITNGTISLLITSVPALLERNYRIPIDPWLGLWITLAVFLHTAGSAGLYAVVGWWDHLTHAMSASLVAGVGYTFARAVDIHSDRIYLPRQFFFIYTLVVVLAFAVVWELFEFGLDVAADATGVPMPLAQHGLDDTVLDLVFNFVGALAVAAFGQAHLMGATERALAALGADPDGEG